MRMVGVIRSHSELFIELHLLVLLLDEEPTPALTPELPGIYDLPLCDFTFNERYGRNPIAESRDPYICGLPGKSYNVTEQRDRIQYLARPLAQEMEWEIIQCYRTEGSYSVFGKTIGAGDGVGSQCRQRI
jgi:hypothetical protein